MLLIFVMKNVALFHKNCPDGYGALSGVVYKLGIKELLYDEERDIVYTSDENFFAIPINHGTDFTRLREILTHYTPYSFTLYMVDIFVPGIYEVIREHTNVKKVIVIDHHKTAEEILKRGVPPEVKDKMELHIDHTHSAAALVWKVLNNQIPEVIKYIEDRDIWKWEFPDSKYVLTALDAKVFNVLKPNEVVEKLLELTKDFPKEELAREGKAMIEFKESVIKLLLKNNLHYIVLPSGHKLLAINSPTFQSDIGNEIAKVSSEGVGCVYTISPSEEGVFVKCSIRSVNGKAREIAQANGGGGHDNASGCRVPLSDVRFEPLESS